MRAPARACALALLLATALSGCCPEEGKQRAIEELDELYRGHFERILAADGTRIFRTGIRPAFAAVKRVLAAYGYEVENEDLNVGALALIGPAPAPLTLEEWTETRDRDLPAFKEVVGRNCGFWAGALADFQPEGVQIVIYVTAVENEPYVEMTAAIKMQSQRLLDDSGYPRRSYPPPNTFEAGLEKFWRLVDREIRSHRRA